MNPISQYAQAVGDVGKQAEHLLGCKKYFPLKLFKSHFTQLRPSDARTNPGSHSRHFVMEHRTQPSTNTETGHFLQAVRTVS